MIGSHIIPRFYLEQFSPPASLPRKPGRVWVYQKGKKPSNRATTVQGFENGYFGFVRPDGSLDEAPEEHLAELERRSNDVLASAKSPLFDWTSRMSRHTLAFYAGLLHARATQRRDFSARNWNRIQKEFAELVADEIYVQELTVLYKKRFPDQDVTAAAIRNRLQMLAQQNQTSASSRNIFLDTLMHNTEIIKNALLEKAWQVWRAPNGVEFVTSDNPLVTFLPIDEQRFAPGHGFRVAGVVAAFPLAPGACLLMGLSGPESVTVSELRVQSVNEVVISLCDRFVYSKTLSERVQKMVDEIGGSYRYGENAFLPIGMRPTDVRAFVRKRMGLD